MNKYLKEEDAENNTKRNITNTHAKANWKTKKQYEYIYE